MVYIWLSFYLNITYCYQIKVSDRVVKSQKTREIFLSVLTHGFLLIGAVIMTFPFIWMILTSLKSPDEVLDSDAFLPAEKLYVVESVVSPSSGNNNTQEIPVFLASEEDVAQATVLNPSFRLNDGEVAVWKGGRADQNSSKLVAVSSEHLFCRRFVWGNYTKAWSQIKPSFSVYFWNSFLLAAVGTCGVLFTSLLAAYAFAFFAFPGKDFVFTIFLATMMVPAQVLLIPNFLTLKGLRWYDTYLGLSVPFIAGVFGIFLLRQFFLAMPRELYDAAVVDGCTKTQFLFKVLLPLSKPSLITLGIFSFLGSWNSLLWPLIVTESADMRTIQVALTIFNQSEGTNWELLMAASTFCQLPLIVAYFLAQRQFIQGIARTGLKG